MFHTVILGSDPSGLSAAYDLSKHNCDVTVLEAGNTLGGLYRTENHQGYRIDLCPQGFSTDSPLVWQLWNALVSEASIPVEVRSLIHYNHRLYNYPLSFTNALKHIGPIDATRIGLSYLKAWLSFQQTGAQQTQQPEQKATEETAKAWLTRHFGAHLSQLFFEPYLAKVWGVGCDRLAATCAQQATLSILRKAIRRQRSTAAYYPTLGMGSLWESCQAAISQSNSSQTNPPQANSRIALDTKVVRIEHTGHRITRVVAKRGTDSNLMDQLIERPVDQLISSLPLLELTELLEAPANVVHAAQQLHYRHLIVVAVIVDTATLFPEHTIYVHQPNVNVARIQNFKNWSPAMVPDSRKTCLGMGYFCDAEDSLWTLSDAELSRMAAEELIELGLVQHPKQIKPCKVARQRNAYPVERSNTVQHLATVQNYLARFENLQSIGRNGEHQYAGLDYCLMSGLRASNKILGGRLSPQMIPGDASVVQPQAASIL
ncbi:MAG: FAD-dependent oxidoreductase [Cyanobacteria bacterium J06632_3]